MLKNIFTNICTLYLLIVTVPLLSLKSVNGQKESPPAPPKAAHAHANCKSPNNQVSDSDYAVLGCDFQPWHY